MAKVTQIYHIIYRLHSARPHYAHGRDWLFSFYHRVLLQFPTWPLPARWRILRVRLASNREPFYVRLNTSDWYVLEDIFLTGEYEPLRQRQLRDVQHIVDLGANAGFSIRLWQQLYPRAAIVGVEPDAANLRMCQRNALHGSGYGAVRLVQACVAGHSRPVALDRSEGEWKFKLQEGDNARATIQALTLPQILGDEERVIDLLKCDIEGAEAEVFADCSAWIGGVRNLVVELHHPYLPAQFLADLESNGGQFQVYAMHERADTAVLFLEQTLEQLNCQEQLPA